MTKTVEYDTIGIETVRLEALRLAVGLMGSTKSPDIAIGIAETFEKYICKKKPGRPPKASG